MPEYNKNEKAERIVGLRNPPINALAVDMPCEFHYHCPVCEYENVVDGNFDERLHWSEYNGFLWCEVCDKDYPGVMCVPEDEPNRAIEVYLNCVQDAIKRAALQNDEDKE